MNEKKKHKLTKTNKYKTKRKIKDESCRTDEKISIMFHYFTEKNIYKNTRVLGLFFQITNSSYLGDFYFFRTLFYTYMPVICRF